MKRKYIIGVIILLVLIAVGIFTIGYQNNTKSNTKQIQQTKTTKKQVTFTGKWSGYKSYTNDEGVRLTVEFKKNHSYELTETNTVSQIWTREYSGTYQIKNRKAMLSPTKVVVKTYASKAALKNSNQTNEEEVEKSNFYHQFGNEQTGSVSIKDRHLVIKHDHETIKLRSVK